MVWKYVRLIIAQLMTQSFNIYLIVGIQHYISFPFLLILNPVFQFMHWDLSDVRLMGNNIKYEHVPEKIKHSWTWKKTRERPLLPCNCSVHCSAWWWTNRYDSGFSLVLLINYFSCDLFPMWCHYYFIDFKEYMSENLFVNWIGMFDIPFVIPDYLYSTCYIFF